MRIAKSSLLPAAAILLGTAACGSVQVQPRTVPSDLAHSAAHANAQLVALALTTPGRGDGMFDISTGSRCEAVSARTTGGALFSHAATITSWSCAGPAPVTSLAADGSGDEFAYGPKLFLKGNGGAWHASPQPGTVLAISAAGRSVWMLLAHCRAGLCRLVLRQSPDGGRTWHAAPAQPPGAVERQGQGGLVRTGPASGYVLALPGGNGEGKPDRAPLWYTADGGASWSRRQIPCGLDAMYDSMSAAPGGALVAVCAGEPSAGSQLKSAVTSANGGRTWTVHVLRCPQVAAACRQPLESGYLGQVDAVTAKIAYLVGPRSDVLMTSDGGGHWRFAAPQPGGQWQYTTQVSFFGRSDGIVIGADGSSRTAGLWRTSNGGRTWSETTPVLR
jgi:hypothetical protein